MYISNRKKKLDGSNIERFLCESIYEQSLKKTNCFNFIVFIHTLGVESPLIPVVVFEFKSKVACTIPCARS